jgi:hypothetical protein
MKTKKVNTIDLSSHIEKIEKGEGFYSVFIAEQQRNSRPARKSINGLRDLFILLHHPAKEHPPKDECLTRLSLLVKKIISVYENSNPRELIRKLKKRIIHVCDKIKEEKINDLFNSSFTQESLPSGEDDKEEVLNNTQKQEIYNMLLENGVSHDEAINELLKY